MSESRLSIRVACQLRILGADIQRIESPGTGRGTPDLFYAACGVEGWVELKYVAERPKRPKTPVRLGLRPWQAVWLRSFGRSGSGRCWVLAQVGASHLLFHWPAVDLLLNDPPWARLLPAALKHWPHGVDYEELLRALTGPLPRSPRDG